MSPHTSSAPAANRRLNPSGRSASDAVVSARTDAHSPKLASCLAAAALMNAPSPFILFRFADDSASSYVLWASFSFPTAAAAPALCQNKNGSSDLPFAHDT